MGGKGHKGGNFARRIREALKKRHGVREIDYDTLWRVLRTRLCLGGIAFAGRKS